MVTGAQGIWGKAERSGFVQPGEAQRRPYSVNNYLIKDTEKKDPVSSERHAMIGPSWNTLCWDTRKQFFIVRVIKYWKRLPKEVMRFSALMGLS